jgi:hypothetical protein
MAYETVVYFDSVYFIESLRAGEDFRSGMELFDNVVRPWSAQGGGIATAHFRVNTAAELRNQLAVVAEHCAKNRRASVLQIDAHGSEAGLELSSKEIVSWEDLATPLARINEACQFNLVVVSSACFGYYMVKTLNPTIRSPAWGIVGPDNDVEGGDLYDAGKAFYETLFSKSDLRAAVGAMNPGKEYQDWTIRILPAEIMFCRLFNIYVSQIATAERDQERVSRIVAQIAPRLDLDVGKTMQARAFIQDLMKNHRFWWERLRTHFLMLDLFPANSVRFPLTFEECTKRAA